MLEIVIEETELFDEQTATFVYVKPITLRLEHSLVSISKWESKWKTPFLSKGEKTQEQSLDYIRCMTMNQGVDPEVYNAINQEHMAKINEYIGDNKTATTFNERNKAPNRQVITSELIYFWMSQYNIPFECQKWHLSRLLTLIRIASIKNQPDEKMSKKATLAQYKSLNAARRKALHTKG